ncbi:phospholipid carrier-dependent glycosyltransferase, partial [Streptosporangium sp. KLBMP 9127]|nr:phospholipid carrier-dependent glycosyltransferase [Streptosporangium sp. KLBMP 9127]
MSRVAVTDFSDKDYQQPEPQGDSVRPTSVRDRLVPPMPAGLRWGWLGPLLVTFFGAFLRFDRLGQPNAIVFDETYYAKDSLSLVNWLVERVAIKDADKLLMQNNPNIWQQCAGTELDKCASYVVHPPLGKWMIGAGEWLFGANPFG